MPSNPAGRKDLHCISRSISQSILRISPCVGRSRINYLILVVLAVIALCLLRVQSNYDPGRWRAVGESASPPVNVLPVADVVRGWALPQGLAPVSDWELYDSHSLSDKINGKAELYLPAGFRQLATRRLALTADSSCWMELFIYHMGSPAGAFAVFSQQVRDGRQPLDIASDAYRSANGLFLTQGPYYLEIIASEESPRIQSAQAGLALAFVTAHPVSAAALDERSLFPADNQVADSVALTAASAFGFGRFDHIYTARYELAGQEATVFLSRRASAAQAFELVQEYVAFLKEYGGVTVGSPAGVGQKMQVVEVLDRFEIVFSHGAYLAGVHDAATLEQAGVLAEALRRNLPEVAP